MFDRQEISPDPSDYSGARESTLGWKSPKEWKPLGIGTESRTRLSIASAHDHGPQVRRQAPERAHPRHRRRRLPRRRLEGRQQEPPTLVPEPRRRSDCARSGRRREIQRYGPSRVTGTETASLAHDGEDLARVRQVSSEDEPRHPGRHPGAQLRPPIHCRSGSAALTSRNATGELGAATSPTLYRELDAAAWLTSTRARRRSRERPPRRRSRPTADRGIPR
jgi:hypothetical protein